MKRTFINCYENIGVFIKKIGKRMLLINERKLKKS